MSTTNNKAVHGIIGVLSFTVTIFYALGCIGAIQTKALKQLAWIYADVDQAALQIKLDSYWGLTALYSTIDSCDNISIICDSFSTGVQKYSECDVSDVCDDCKQAGIAAVVFVCIGFACILVSFITGMCRLTIDTKETQVVSGVFAILCSMCGVIAVGAFSDCYRAINDEDTANAIAYHNGAILVLTGLLLSFIVGVIHFILPPAAVSNSSATYGGARNENFTDVNM